MKLNLNGVWLARSSGCMMVEAWLGWRQMRGFRSVPRGDFTIGCYRFCLDLARASTRLQHWVRRQLFEVRTGVSGTGSAGRWELLAPFFFCCGVDRGLEVALPLQIRGLIGSDGWCANGQKWPDCEWCGFVIVVSRRTGVVLRLLC